MNETTPSHWAKQMRTTQHIWNGGLQPEIWHQTDFLSVYGNVKSKICRLYYGKYKLISCGVVFNSESLIFTYQSWVASRGYALEAGKDGIPVLKFNETSTGSTIPMACAISFNARRSTFWLRHTNSSDWGIRARPAVRPPGGDEARKINSVELKLQ